MQRFANRPTQVNHGFFQRQVRNIEKPEYERETTNRNEQNIYEATLSRNPKNLYVLWEEYEFGVEGRMPAKNFSIRERGRNRDTIIPDKKLYGTK